jgi:hypothetical protein
MKPLYLALTLIALALSSSQAAPKEGKEDPAKAGSTTPAKGAKGKGKAKTGKMPFYGEVVAVTTRTLTLKGGEGKEDRKLSVGADTRIHNDEKPATAEDIKVGKKVGGSAEKSADGSLKALTINVGAAQAVKPKAKAKEGDSKAKTKK